MAAGRFAAALRGKGFFQTLYLAERFGLRELGAGAVRAAATSNVNRGFGGRPHAPALVLITGRAQGPEIVTWISGPTGSGAPC